MAGRSHAIIDGGLVVLHPATGRFQVLSTSAALVFTSIDGIASLDEIVEAIAHDTGSDPDAIRLDVQRAVASMVHEGLVTLVGSNPREQPGDDGHWNQVRLARLAHAPRSPVLGPYLAGGTPVRVHVCSDDVAARVAPLLALLPALPHDAADSATRVDLVTDGRNRFRVYVDGRPVERPTTSAALAAELVLSACNQAASSGPPGSLRFHAGVVAHDGKGLVICGTSGAGKSSLTLALLRAGWEYLSDEIAVLDPASLHLTPYPKWVDLSDEALTRVGHSAPRPQEPTDFERHLPPAALGTLAHGATLAGIVVLQRAPLDEGAPRVVPMAPTDALLALLPHVYESSWLAPQALQGLADVCGTVPVSFLHRAPFEKMVADVGALLGE